MGDKRIVDNFKEFICEIEVIDDSLEIIEYIFDYHFKYNDNLIIHELADHISTALKINDQSFLNPDMLLDYLTIDKILECSEVEEKHHHILSFLNKIKRKYGPVVRQSQVMASNPFGMSGMDINIKNNSSIHNLTIIRGDGEHISLNVESKDLMLTNLVLTRSLKQAIEKGIFSFDYQMIKDYLHSNGEMIAILDDLISEQQNE